jgi:hypothetical protein
MSQQKSSQQSKGKVPSGKERQSRWRMIIVSAACLSLVATSWITAQQSGRRVTRRIEPPARPTPVAAPLSLTPSLPAKEYIYAGGKLVATEEPSVFNDVPLGSLFYEEVNKIAAREVTVGCSTNPPLFCADPNPNDPPGSTNGYVTRGQMAAFIIRALGMHIPPAPAYQRFTDVPPSHPFYTYIDQMAFRGITLGCNTNLYCPDGFVTHEQMAAFMERANNNPNPQTPPYQAFCDVPSSNQFYALIHAYAVTHQVWLGCGNTGSCAGVSGCQTTQQCFCPTANVTRRQMARILVRNFNL